MEGLCWTQSWKRCWPFRNIRISPAPPRPLSLTQPAVSHHIALLEQQLGVTLFVRGRGALKLTPEGEIAVRYARRFKALSAKLREGAGRGGQARHPSAHRHYAHVREQPDHRSAGQMLRHG